MFIIGPAYPLRGGLATFDELFCRALIKDGHNAEIISYSLQYPNFLFPGSTQYDQSGKAPAGITIHTKINSVNPFNWLSVGKFIREQKPDLIVIRYWIPFMGPVLGTIARKAKKAGVKVIAICDNVIPHEKRKGDKTFTNYFLKSCHGFVTMSKAVMEDLGKFVQTDKKEFLLHPLYTSFGEKVDKRIARVKLGINADDKVILFFGLIRKYKGLDILLEAMADERIKKMDIKLLIGGEFYEDRTYYDEIIKKNALENSIILHGKFIANEDVKFYFSAADMVTLTYRDATQSGVTQVAFQFEKPTLVTNVGGLSEIIPHGKCGYVVEPNKKEIADAIVDFYVNNKEELFTAGMKEEKKKYDWEIFTGRIQALYNTL
ncbi:MAG: glycosyltransferase [Bacteroidia bacterium]|nr:glycosyltransferase [Bacteroidia bacterium]